MLTVLSRKWIKIGGIRVEEDGPTINRWLTSSSENMQPTRRTMENKLPRKKKTAGENLSAVMEKGRMVEKKMEK